MNILLISALFFFAGLTLFILLNKIKEKRALIKAIKNNNAAYEKHFTNEEDKLKKILGEALSEKLNGMIANVVKVERDSYKKLCAVFIDHHSAAIQLLPHTINQITTAYINCLSQVVNLSKDNISGDAVPLQETPSEAETLFQYEALIEQLRYEKQTYSDKYKESQSLLSGVYLKYKDKLELDNVESPQTMSVKEMTTVFKLNTDNSAVTKPENKSVPVKDVESQDASISSDEKE